MAVDEVLLLLGTDQTSGLDDREVTRRLLAYGPNQLPRAAAVGWPRRLLRQLHNPLIYVLLAAGMVTLFLKEYVDASVVFGVVVINAIVGFVQESKANSALNALQSMVSTRAHVIRDGCRQQIDSEQLVPGDLVLVDAGDKVPADLRLVAENSLHVDESALTGELVPVAKDDAVLALTTPVADRRNMVYSGTLITAGKGSGIVVATGGHTELGEIHRLVSSAQTLATPLTQKLAKFSTWLTAIILALAAFTFVIGISQQRPPAEMFTAAVALAVGAIPEGLPAAVTITLAIGVSRMARHGAVIRRLPTVETLGSATVICSDKTGTLTQNQMTVQTLWTLSQEVTVTRSQGQASPTGALIADEAMRWNLLTGANCNDSSIADAGAGIGDPTETAMLRVAKKYGTQSHGLPRHETVPFSSEKSFMATTHTDPATGHRVLLVKGAVERVVELCDRQMKGDGSASALDAGAVSSTAEGFAKQGMRVLATAHEVRPHPRALDDIAAGAHRGLTFTGLQVMFDPPRATALLAVTNCRAAGLEVKMITGDHPATATSIAQEVGLLDDGGVGDVLIGTEIDRIKDEDLPQAVEGAKVFARVSPGQKLRLVQALQARHHVVAMTGDGVKDAPALKQANIGVAMGLAGSEAAKDASDMVLTDDDFATIEAAVEEGRGVFDNLTKFIVWTLPTNMGEGMVILAAIVLGGILPILPTQILWINMTTAVALGLTLAWEPKEPGIMQRPPRDPQKSLLTAPVITRTLLVSVLLVIGAWWIFDYEYSRGASLAESRTAAVNLFVTVQAFYLFSCRSLTRSVWATGWFTNRWLLVGVGAQAVGQAALTYLPAMNTLFQTAPIGWQTWLRILAIAAITASIVAVDKHRLRNRTL